MGKVLEKPKRFRFGDFVIILFFLSIAVLCVRLFWLDLMQTINLQNTEPVGTVIIKKNIVQRRHTDRVLWDRLATESPVYLWNLIRIAEDSAATLNIKNTSIDLDENTLIRIALAADGESLLIELNGGNLSVDTSNETESIFIDLNGKQLQASPGTVLSAVSRDDGVSIQVNSGSAKLIEEDSVREISSGTAVAIDSAGYEIRERAAVVTSPAPNARYLKNTSDPRVVNFSWNRINLPANEMLKLEISSEKDFSDIAFSAEGLSQARALVNYGSWYWRLLSQENTALASGRLTVADSSGPALENPAANSRIRYQNEAPAVNFQWNETEEATSYILEVSDSADFSTLRLRRQSSNAFITEPIEAGVWFWRVLPVFPDLYSGSGSYSKTSYFSVEQAAAAPENASLSKWIAAETTITTVPPQVPVDMIPASVVTVVPEPERQPEPEPAPPAPVPAPAPRSAPAPAPAPRAATPAPAPRAAAVPTPAPAPAPAPTPAPASDVSLPPPQNMRPGRGIAYGFEELKAMEKIEFNWDPVQSANAYIFTIYQQTPSGRVQIFRSDPLRTTSYTLEDLDILDNGTFAWQVEAVRIGNNNAVERRGRVGESQFIIDVPVPGRIQVEDTGILYGN